jgi:hypothetical protein
MEMSELQLGSSHYGRAGVTNPNETTPWLRHTRWPELFRNRSLEIITTSAQQPDFVQGQDYLLFPAKGRKKRVPDMDVFEFTLAGVRAESRAVQGRIGVDGIPLVVNNNIDCSRVDLPAVPVPLP